MCSLNGNTFLNFLESLESVLIATSGLGKGRLNPIICLFHHRFGNVYTADMSDTTLCQTSRAPKSNCR